jgi:hypothetical protein
VSLVARVIRQFYEGADCLTLERMVGLPFQPTMGTRLDLREHGVEYALEVVAVTIRAQPDRPGFRQADADIFTSPEPLASAETRQSGWLAGLAVGLEARRAP